MAVKVYSRFDRPVGVGQKFVSEQPVYGLVIDKVTGISTVQAVGVEDTYAKIQEANVGLGVEDFLREYALDPVTGLPTNGNGLTPQFLDNYSMPKSMLEAHRVVHQAKEDFAKFPIEIRSYFKNDLGQFLAYVDTHGGIEKVKMSLREGELKEKFLSDRAARKNAIKLDREIAAELDGEGGKK